MKILYKIFFFFIASIIFFTHEIRGMTLKEKLCQAEEGSYLVFEQNNTITFFYIYNNNGKKILIEEVSIPAAKIDATEISDSGFCSWFEKGAPNHTSWTMSLINLDNGHFEEMYSFTRKGWIDVSKMDNFMTTLFNLNFEEVPLEKRRRIGLPPGRNQIDMRPIWQPRMIVNGKILPEVSFSSWKSRWPNDSSELSHKIIELYIPDEKAIPNLPNYPTYFPFVVEIEGKFGSAKIRVIDSGMNAHSPSSGLPLRPLQYLGPLRWTQDSLIIAIKAPLYYEDFIVLAEKQNGNNMGNTVSLPFQIIREGELITIFASIKDLQSGFTYRFVVTSKEHPAYCIETEAIKYP